MIGMVLQALLKIKAIKEKAVKNNVQFSAKDYIVDDWISHSASVTTIFLFLFFVDEFTNINASVINYVKIGFAFVGYTGSDVASRLFSVVNKRVNDSIGYKANIADIKNGTTEQPTPIK